MPSRYVCDVCGNATDRVVVKLFKTPRNQQQDGKVADHTNYTAHANVGLCCINKVNEISWQERKTNKRRGAGNPV